MYTDMHPRHCCDYSCCASRKCTTFLLQLGVTPISSAVALGCMYMRVCACMSSAGQRGRGCRPRMHGRVYPCILGMCRIARAHLPPSSMPAPVELVADNQPAQVTFTLQDLCLNTGLQLSATWQEEASSAALGPCAERQPKRGGRAQAYAGCTVSIEAVDRSRSGRWCLRTSGGRRSCTCTS